MTQTDKFFDITSILVCLSTKIPFGAAPAKTLLETTIYIRLNTKRLRHPETNQLRRIQLTLNKHGMIDAKIQFYPINKDSSFPNRGTTSSLKLSTTYEMVQKVYTCTPTSHLNIFYIHFDPLGTFHDMGSMIERLVVTLRNASGMTISLIEIVCCKCLKFGS